MSEPEANFEAPLTELRKRISELGQFPTSRDVDRELAALRKRLRRTTLETYRHLSAWQTTQVARNFERPYALDFIRLLMSDWVELHGDRRFRDDSAIVAGLATFRGRSIVVIGNQKGRGTRARVRRNFGMASPEGHRKALRVMRLAARFGLPIVTLVDTPGADPGVGAEERGQASAIAENLIEMATLPVPIVVVITGEGWSGGGLALGVGDRTLMLENAVLSVISPEGCSAILWPAEGGAAKARAAQAMKITAPDLARMGIIDEVIPEPLGGAHADLEEAVRRLGEPLDRALRRLERKKPEALVEARYRRLRSIGALQETSR